MGTGLSLLVAFVILVAFYSCDTILTIVICVIGFTVANDWKLGMSVDNAEPLAISCL